MSLSPAIARDNQYEPHSTVQNAIAANQSLTGRRIQRVKRDDVLLILEEAPCATEATRLGCEKERMLPPDSNVRNGSN